MADKGTRNSKTIGPDGLAWSAKEATELNDLAVAAFGRGAGKAFLRYLRRITIETVAGPEISDSALRHREGMRALVAIIETRVQQGQESRKNQ